MWIRERGHYENQKRHGPEYWNALWIRERGQKRHARKKVLSMSNYFVSYVRSLVFVFLSQSKHTLSV